MLLRLDRNRRKDESGSALIVVIGVMTVALILTAVAMSSVVNGLGYSTATRAGVQSQAAAEAGIAAARAGLNVIGNCAAQPGALYASNTAPKYTATVEYDAGSGWQTGCPTATTTRVRITSTGDATATGVAGQSAGDTSKVEAVLRWLTPGVTPTGTGMYFYGGVGVESNSVLDLSESKSAGLMIKDGNLDCMKNNGVFNGSVLVRGDLNFSKDCRVNGSAWVTGMADLGSKGFVAGDLTAPSSNPADPTNQVGGDYLPGGAIPDVPGWSEIGWAPDSWLDADGQKYEVRTLSGVTCKLPNGSLGGTVSGKPVIIDARGCPEGGPAADNNTTVKLTSDVVIYAKQFDWKNKVEFKSSSTAARRLWFVTPDGDLTDNKPTCVAPGDFTVWNNLVITAPVAAFLYTPCAFQGVNGFTWNGQIYSGKYSNVKNNPSFAYTPIGIAGTDLDTGAPTPIIDNPQPGAVVSIRDLSISG